MINAILTGLFNIVISLVNLILTPIDLAITAALPDLANAFSAVGQMFNIINSGIAFALDFSGLSDTAISLVVAYFVFKLTVPITFSSIKLALKWYSSLKF